ncbi:DNA helicase [Anaerobacillus alkalidiazotrophicus]|uniref:DNA helicase n=1 Tax=Anaerobacillus alkalidiazotrophicus TaxID=472963 RepID=A0A1S2M8M9_9BACI|nr:DEAD/DEAH box helicase family protein [Anaerobacillus alkalidiazotrophicus]OIJ20954.1 DNA helicase [Anaerobacillus alkalidiazotrophicus]
MTRAELITESLVKHLIRGMEQASSICILTSFVMKSGCEMLFEPLRKAAERGADIKICTGDYLFITQPEALKAISNIHKNIEIRLWKSNGTSFHPKAYLFQFQNDGQLIVGSSNLSRSALTTGVEWNVSLSESTRVYEDALDQFTKIMYHEQTIVVNDETIKTYEEKYEHFHQKHPNLVRTWTKREEMELMLPSEQERANEMVKEATNTYGEEIKPRFAQIPALEELETTIEEGYKSALVVMATGLGKTYLAAFFAKSFQRILFIAHREEILHQAKHSFEHVMNDKTYGIYNGKQKEGEADVVFASIFTLSMKQHLEMFSPDEFDLIIVDEFHHAAARSYSRVLDYFQPQFLLGITATPDRNDNKDVYALCDGNVAFRLDFLEAIQRQWLAPFHYYGIYDDTDYRQLTWLGNRYAEEELLQVQLKEEMAENIVQAWEKHKQSRTLVFCSSIKQADYLANYFQQKGYKAISLHSRQVEVSRKHAIELLNNGEIDAIFTVDLFNEGIDIPSVDTLLFVRPTESLTVFTQQIGRGLRLHPEKNYCVVIDLIGNYRNADVKLSVFDTSNDPKKPKQFQPNVPANCVLNIETEVINLLAEIARKFQPRKEKLKDAYFTLKQELGRRPTYLEIHLKGQSESIQYKQEFNSYLGFLYWADELSEREKEVFKRYETWLIEVEKTGMAKSYKMVVLLAMLQRGVSDWYQPITPEETAPFFHHYLTETEYRKKIDFSDKETKRLWDYNEEKVSKLIVKMPMTKWSGSSKGLVTFENNRFGFSFDVVKEDEELLYEWTREICEYRLHVHFERKSN